MRTALPLRQPPSLTLCVLLLVLAAQPTRAVDETLGDFEKEIEKEEPSRHEEPARSEDQREQSEADAKDAAGLMIASVIAAAIAGDENLYEKRVKGQPALASLRLESSYQHLSGTDVEGLAVRGEAFARGLGIAGEYHRHWEASPRDRLTSWTVEARARLVPGESVRLDLALGVRGISRESEHSGLHGGFSLGLYPTRWLGFETDLRWADIGSHRLGDYRGGLLLRMPQIQNAALRCGYRAIDIGDSTLHGPELGLVSTW